jgi:hypothetical protein
MIAKEVTCRGCHRRFKVCSGGFGRHLGDSRNKECRTHYYDMSEDDVPPASTYLDDGDDTPWDHQLYQLMITDIVFKDLAELLYVRYVPDGVVQFMQQSVRRWNEEALKDMEEELRVQLPSQVHAQIPLIVSTFRNKLNVFNHLDTESKILNYCNSQRPTLTPVQNIVGTAKHHRTYGVLIIDWLTELLRRDEIARAHIVKASDKWLSGAKMYPSDTISDFDDGSTFRAHPFSQPGEEDQDIKELRVCIMLGYDDLELLNPLGVCRGDQKQACFYGAIMNLPRKHRFAHEYLSMLCICGEDTLHECDPIRVIAGANAQNGEIIANDWASLGAQFRSGFPGLVREVPLGSDSAACEKVLIRFSCICMSGDFVAKTKLGPTSQGTTAWKFCPGCDYDKRVDKNYSPFSFFKGRCSANTSKWNLRSRDQIETELKQAFTIEQKSEREKFLADHGYRRKLQLEHFALHKDYFPNFDITEMMVEDGMHLQADGLLQYLGYWVFHTLIVKRKYFTLKEANRAIASAPTTLWSDGIPPRPLHSHLLKGGKGGRPKSSNKLRFTASQMMKFALAR